jgi:PRTRC genetic system protein E
MSFFKRIADLMGENYSLQFITKMQGEHLTVTFIPKFDASKSSDVTDKIQPFSVTNTPEELDRTFMTIIGTALIKTGDFAQALKAYEEGLGAAKKELDKKTGKGQAKAEDKPEKKEPVAQQQISMEESAPQRTAKPEAKKTEDSDWGDEPQTVPVAKPPAKEKDDEPIRAARLEDIAGEDMGEEGSDEAPWVEDDADQDLPKDEQTKDAINEEEDDQW